MVDELRELHVVGATTGSRLETALSELQEFAGRHELPRELLKALQYATRLERGTDLSDAQLRDRLDKLRELRILPEQRVASDLDRRWRIPRRFS